ncbi:hypothetical protein H6P81_005811 [Aristolochia fimbriata]|uniref:DNA polymerase delta subunit 4 n=1 Tax=Aristolochia fimbriata TaxID=158543 RepID=A0AAV7EZ31_ARIFI|nr:hypothetical protein H6P81_005811 [Aristolochia fimbriata]
MASGTIKGFYRQRKTTKTKPSSSKVSSKTNKSGRVGVGLGAETAQPASLISHGALDLKEDYDDAEECLRQFDMNMAYGPCLGLTRLARWERAEKLGLDPPKDVEKLLRSTTETERHLIFRRSTLKGLFLLPRLPVVSAARGIRAVQMSGTTKVSRPNFLTLEDAGKETSNLSDGFRFRVVSYNILAQVYVKSASFPHSPIILPQVESPLKGDFGGADLPVILFSAELMLKEEIEYNDLVKSVNGMTVHCGDEAYVTLDINERTIKYLVSGSSSSTELENSSGSLHLCSLYASIGGEPPFTTCTPRFRRTLDYVFFSPSTHLKPVSFLELPGPDSPDIIGGLPNHHYPSDHLPIGADFEVSTPSTIQGAHLYGGGARRGGSGGGAGKGGSGGGAERGKGRGRCNCL